jgi:hypothetical protein
MLPREEVCWFEIVGEFGTEIKTLSLSSGLQSFFQWLSKKLSTHHIYKF